MAGATVARCKLSIATDDELTDEQCLLGEMDSQTLPHTNSMQASANAVDWSLAFISAYFCGQGAADPGVAAKAYTTFCITGGVVTVLSWLFFVESEFRSPPRSVIYAD
jgi:hypothetical protein